MENPEEILHSLEEFAKLKPKDIPRELEEYLSFVAKTGDPVYQWSAVKSLFKEKLVNVITEFYESCPSVEIPPCPNVEMFNYESMKNFILEKLDTFVAAPFTVQRICELLTTPRKEYNRIDKYMRALEKNILVVSTTEPGNRRNTENGDGIVNGIESEHLAEGNSSNDINVEEMDDTPTWPRINPVESNICILDHTTVVEPSKKVSETAIVATTSECRLSVEPSTSNTESVITCITEKSSIPAENVASEDNIQAVTNGEEVTQEATDRTPTDEQRSTIEPIPTDDNAISESSEASSEENVNEPDQKNDIVAAETIENLNTDSSSNDTEESDIVSKSERDIESSESSLDSTSTEEKVENLAVEDVQINEEEKVEEPTIVAEEESSEELEEKMVESKVEIETEVFEDSVASTVLATNIQKDIPPEVIESITPTNSAKEVPIGTEIPAEVITEAQLVDDQPQIESHQPTEEETPMEIDIETPTNIESTESTADVPNDKTTLV